MESKMKKLLSIVIVAALALSLAVAAVWDQPAQALTADEITAAQNAAATELAAAQARADKAWTALTSLPTPEEVKAGTKTLPDTCPNCGKKTSGTGKEKLVWAILEGEQTTNINGTSGTYSGVSVHVYLTGDVTYNGEDGTAFFTAPYGSATMCVYTNGYNITSTQKPAYFGTTYKSYVIAWSREGRDVPGSTIIGHSAGDLEKGAVVITNPGSDNNEVHLFGGTYKKYNPASSSYVVGPHGNAGKIYIYEGTTIEGGTKGSAVYLNGDMGYGRAQLNMYGGTIQGGTGAAAIGVETSSRYATSASNNETFYCTFNMYGGTVNGGAGQAAVEAIDEDYTAAKGEKDCRINIYGGTINGNEANSSPAVKLSAANSDFKIYGGTINGKSGNVNGPAIRTDVASKITVAGGNINGTTTTGYGGNIYVNAAATVDISGGTISGGISKSGGNIYLNNGATVTMSGGTISGGEARGSISGGGNVYVAGSATSFTMTGGRIENGIGKFDTDGTTALTNVYGPNIYITAATVNLSGGTVYGGQSNNSTGGGSIYMTGTDVTDADGQITSDTSKYAKLNISGNAVVEEGNNEKAYGGNICAYRGIITVSGSAKVRGGNAKLGAGNIHLERYSKLTLQDSAEISGGMSGTEGGNIHVTSNASLIMEGGTVSGGTAGTEGGNIYTKGTVNATDGDILNGTAGTNGGNIRIADGEVTLGEGVLVDQGTANVAGKSGQGGGNIYIRGNDAKLTTAATITNGKTTGENAAGGNINIGSTCEVEINGGVIAHGRVEGTAGDSWGGNIRSYGENTKVTVSGGLIYDGTTKGTNTASFGISNKETVVISGGTIISGLTLSKSLTSLKISGAPKILRSMTIDGTTYTGSVLSINSGLTADISELSEEADIWLTGAANVAFTAANEKAETLKKCFTSGNRSYCVTLKDNQLYYTAHSKTSVAQAEATCEAIGYSANYYYCKTCNEYYNEAHTERVANSVAEIPATGHDYKGVVTAPTCEDEGYTTYTCQNDATHTYTEETPALGHNIVLYSAEVPAVDCITFGKEAVYTCTVCECYFEDAEGKIKQDSEMPGLIFPNGHELTYVSGTPATCTQTGIKEHYFCSVCDGTYAENEPNAAEEIEIEIPTLDHTEKDPVEESRVEATLNAPGSYDEVVYCDVCGTEIRRETKEIPQLTGAAAAIDGYYYATFAEALAAVKEGETITLLAPIVVAKGETLELNLNGFDIAYTSDVMGEAMFTNNGTLVLTGNGKICYTYTGAADPAFSKGNYTVANNGSLTVDGVTVENATAKMGHACFTITNGNGGEVILVSGLILNTNNYAVRMFGNGSLTVNGGEIRGTRAVWMQAPGSDAATAPAIELTVNGGKLTGTGESAGYKLAVYSYSYGNSLKNVSITVNDGEIDGDIALSGGNNKTEAETVTIIGGTVTDLYSYADDEVAGKTVNVSGGTFLNPVYEVYCAEDFVPVDNGNGTYGVVMDESVAQIGDTKYATLQAAIAAAKAGETVVLLDNVDASNEVVLLMKGIKLDLNGKELKAMYLITTTGGSDIIDSTDGEALLVMAKDNLTVVNPACLPIWIEAEGGYRFAKVQFKFQGTYQADGSFLFQYYLTGALDGSLKEQLKYVETNGLNIVLRIAYTSSDNADAKLDLVIPAEKVVDYAGKATGLFTTYIRGLQNLGTATITPCVTYGNIALGNAEDGTFYYTAPTN